MLSRTQRRAGQTGVICAGRVQTILIVKFGGVALMAYMGLVPPMWTSLAIILPVYLVRTAIINSAYPIQKSILMDYVPKVSLSKAMVVSNLDRLVCSLFFQLPRAGRKSA